jgi:hypothetical protein
MQVSLFYRKNGSLKQRITKGGEAKTEFFGIDGTPMDGDGYPLQISEKACLAAVDTTVRVAAKTVFACGDGDKRFCTSQENTPPASACSAVSPKTWLQPESCMPSTCTATACAAVAEPMICKRGLWISTNPRVRSNSP